MESAIELSHRLSRVLVRSYSIELANTLWVSTKQSATPSTGLSNRKLLLFQDPKWTAWMTFQVLWMSNNCLARMLAKEDGSCLSCCCGESSKRNLKHFGSVAHASLNLGGCRFNFIKLRIGNQKESERRTLCWLGSKLRHHLCPSVVSLEKQHFSFWFACFHKGEFGLEADLDLKINHRAFTLLPHWLPDWHLFDPSRFAYFTLRLGLSFRKCDCCARNMNKLEKDSTAKRALQLCTFSLTLGRWISPSAEHQTTNYKPQTTNTGWSMSWIIKVTRLATETKRWLLQPRYWRQKASQFKLTKASSWNQTRNASSRPLVVVRFIPKSRFQV